MVKWTNQGKMQFEFAGWSNALDGMVKISIEIQVAAFQKATATIDSQSLMLTKNRFYHIFNGLSTFYTLSLSSVFFCSSIPIYPLYFSIPLYLLYPFIFLLLTLALLLHLLSSFFISISLSLSLSLYRSFSILWRINCTFIWNGNPTDSSLFFHFLF